MKLEATASAFSSVMFFTITFTSTPASDSALCAVTLVITTWVLGTLTSAAIVLVKVAFAAAPKSLTVRPMSETDMRTSRAPLAPPS